MAVTLRIASLAILLLACFTHTTELAAQTYPSRSVRIIVPFSPGGPTDVYGRILAQKLSEALKRAFVIENRPGAGTMVGTDVAAKAEPDGYTLVMISSTHATNESLAPNKPFQLMRDFVAVAPMVSTDLVMVVHPSVPVKDVREFIALAKAKPGALNYASSGLGSNYHMAAELFKAMSGTDMVHVPYTGSAGARNDIIGGQVQMMFDSIPTMAPLILAGNVKALATTGTERSPILPGVPTLAEAGLPGYQATTWIGLMAPAGTPKPIVDLLNAEANKILSAPELRKSWAAQGANAMSMTPAEFDAYIRAEIDKWAEVVKISGVKIN